MEKLEALELIDKKWHNSTLSLEEKLNGISDAFYAVGLDILTTATYIKATPAEFNAFLSLSYLDEEMIKLISKVNPPKTTWLFLASGNEEEIRKALTALSEKPRMKSETIGEFIYQQMLDVAGPSIEQRVSQLTGDELLSLAKKAKAFKTIEDKSIKFLNSVAYQKKRGKVLSYKQLPVLTDILNKLADNKIIQRKSIDGDAELCNKVLDAIDR